MVTVASMSVARVASAVVLGCVALASMPAMASRVGTQRLHHVLHAASGQLLDHAIRLGVLHDKRMGMHAVAKRHRVGEHVVPKHAAAAMRRVDAHPAVGLAALRGGAHTHTTKEQRAHA